MLGTTMSILNLQGIYVFSNEMRVSEIPYASLAPCPGDKDDDNEIHEGGIMVRII